MKGRTRRHLLQSAGAASLAAAAGARPAQSATASVLDQLGIRPVVNFRGTHTVIGASKPWPELQPAMAELARHYVVLEELQEKIGERLSRLIGCEAALVTSGAAGAIALGTYACLAGTDERKIRQLPDLTGMKSEALIQKVHRNGYDHAVRSAGVKIVEVETREQLLNAASSRTALMYFLGGQSGDWNVETPIPLADCIAIGRKAGFPVLVDAANMLPPWGNIPKLAALGTDLIAVSGGKHLRGPQSSGILAGRKDLIAAAALNASPHSDSNGRPFKVGREEMVALWLAVEKYAKLDFVALDRECERQAKFLAGELGKLPTMQVSFAPHDRTRRVHRVIARWDQQKTGLTVAAVEKRLLDGTPRIATLREKDGLMFVVFMNDAGDEKLAAGRMKEIFSAA
ncbi:MAG: selenocysteine synthase [Acidobacteria bacterium]|nr:selenocysteine synthase [Acidobacteriota bacterium]